MKNYKEEDGNYHLLSETINILNGLTVIELSFSTPPPPPPIYHLLDKSALYRGFLVLAFSSVCLYVCELIT